MVAGHLLDPARPRLPPVAAVPTAPTPRDGGGCPTQNAGAGLPQGLPGTATPRRQGQAGRAPLTLRH